jgi:hypothetical protein
MSAENFLWGAPRIHGELLKLGFTVSERTVSRYLRNRLRVPSQTWRTFLSNHFGNQVLSSTVRSFVASSDDVVVGDGHVFSFGCAPSSDDALYAATQWAVARWSPTFHRTAPTFTRRRTRAGSNKDPPPLLRRRDCPARRTGVGYCVYPGPSRAGLDSFAGTGSTPVLAFSAYLQSGGQRRLGASYRPRNACQRPTLAAVRILARHLRMLHNQAHQEPPVEQESGASVVPSGQRRECAGGIHDTECSVDVAEL